MTSKQKKWIPALGLFIASISALGAAVGQGQPTQVTGDWTINLHTFFAVLLAVIGGVFMGGVYANRIMGGQAALTTSVQTIMARMEKGDEKFEHHAIKLRDIETKLEDHLRAHGLKFRIVVDGPAPDGCLQSNLKC